MSNTRQPRTKRGAARQADAILRRCRHAMRGGLTFGMDWPTFRITFPADYARIQELRAMYPKLPD